MSDDYVEDASLLDDDTLEESVNLDEENVASNTANSGAAAGGGEEEDDDPELAAIKARVRQMEEEAEKLKEMQTEVNKQLGSSTPGRQSLNGSINGSMSSLPSLSADEKAEVDARSVYVGNVDYGATAEELEQHFHGCGSINRVTILCNKFDGHPKGFAYVEFTDKDSISTAMALDDSLFRGRQIKVNPKRTNKPGITTTNRPPRGGRGGFRGAARGARGRGGFGAIRRPRFRGRGYYSPY